ncbi:hypothetical protein BV25DRAFT_1299148 [Artomyces pyxidatus]|uniref:Uncharacterized protein n=1 Tax=Artomyces pyxidatus TaxID=48021 RepID=A0ACB8SP80_9AGAM|nr:hypothetical protein BV25DRAFT_1299148 [Artomyces pyxidatus]
MSFSGTPLGQGRRLDHRTFLNKNPHPTTTLTSRAPNPAPVSERSIPTSYAYGAPTLGTRSPPKPLSSSSRDDSSHHHTAPDTSTDDPALIRFARLKQRETITAEPNPTKWSVKDTSVQIANAFHQAATSADDMAQHNPNESRTLNPNDSWASSGSRTTTNVPRSTSVEYEKETQSTSTRRLGAPPSRLAPPARSTGAARKSLSKTQSVRYVPDSEGEEPPPENGRARTPLDTVVDVARRTAFYLRQRSQEPEPGPSGQTNSYSNNDSYDYAAEEREYQSQAAKRAAHKRNRMSADNKAYRPTQSDLEDSDEYVSDDGKKGRRRKSKKGLGGPLTTLPVANYQTKRRRRKGTKGDGVEEEGDSGSEERESPQRSVHSAQRISVPRELERLPSVARGSVPPAPIDPFNDLSQMGDTSLDDFEQGLDSIPEDEEAEFLQSQSRHRSAFSIGSVIGSCVHFVFQVIKGAIIIVLRIIAGIMGITGRVLGGVFDILFNQPVKWLSNANPAPVVTLLKYLVIIAVAYGTWQTLQNTDLSRLIPRSSHPTFQAPEFPASNVAEISARLQALENALAGLSLDAKQVRARVESSARSQSEVTGRLGALETRLQKESARAAEEHKVDHDSVCQRVQAVRSELEVLRGLVTSVQRSEEDSAKSSSDAEARAKLAALEERIGSVEGGVREALELGKTAAKVGGVGAAAAWWNKITSGSRAVTIKSTDGQDVTEAIAHLVDTAVSRQAKDTLGKPDFALHSGGASIIPSLTSPTLEIRPRGLQGKVLGMLTGNGYAIGLPPIMALHYDTHNGRCWPFPGSQGQLGVLLAHPVYIDEFAIDHVASEVAWDMRSAPRKMEVWGLVEGRDNLRKVAEWEARKAEAGEEREAYPPTLPRTAKYVRIAQFEYDVDAPQSVQTFAVAQDVRELRVDFGLVVLRVESNWGREYTCLYRFRVHGEKLDEDGAPAPPMEGEADAL